MNNITFERITNECINNRIDLDTIMYEIALEATIQVDEDGSASEVKNPDNIVKSLLDKLHRMIDKMISFIGTLMLKIKNSFSRVLETDKGFKEEIKKAQEDRRPLNAIKVITYPYNNGLLNNMMMNMKTQVNKIFTSMDMNKPEDDNSLLNKSNEDIMNLVFHAVNDNVKDLQSMNDYIKDNFRGEKKEITILQGRIPELLNIANGYLSFNKNMTAELNRVHKLLTDLKSKSKTRMMGNGVSDEDKKAFIKQINNLTHVYNLYGSFLKLLNELRIEQTMNSRIILKKLYQI